MPRLKLDLPASFPFSTDLQVRVSDVNYGGHLGNDALLSLLHEARVQYLQSLGWTEMDIAGVSIIMTDAALVYKGEAFLGDVLRIRVAIADLQTSACDVVYLVTAARSGTEVARAKTGIAFYDYGKRKVVPMPEEFRRRVHD
jgi:acyl-CoA thioester hydrolase